MPPAARRTETVHFFLYDSIKIGSLPEMILLRRVLKPQLLASYVAVVGAGIVAVGYLFNLILA